MNRSAEKLLDTISPSASVKDAVKSRLMSCARLSVTVTNWMLGILISPYSIVSCTASIFWPAPSISKNCGNAPLPRSPTTVV
ncbi:hypothetical protein D3C72_2080190 [compost metagenome]